MMDKMECIGSLSTRFSGLLFERIKAVTTIASTQSSDEDVITATELDSHADSPVVGKNVVILESLNKSVTVSGFSSEIGKPIRVKVVNAAVAYDCDITGETHIMVLYNALHIPSMENNLVPPFAMRLAGLKVNECPKFLAKNPTIEHHSVYFPDAICMPSLKMRWVSLIASHNFRNMSGSTEKTTNTEQK